MSDKMILTKQKIDELKEELKRLEGDRKKELSSSLEQARLSDVSEDTDDIIAVMNELDKVDQRINEVKEILSNSSVLKKGACEVNKVTIGSKVTLRNSNKTTVFHVVSEVESDPSKNKISDKSPLGKALLKAKKGDCVKIEINERKIEYKVLDIC